MNEEIPQKNGDNKLFIVIFESKATLLASLIIPAKESKDLVCITSQETTYYLYFSM